MSDSTPKPANRLAKQLWIAALSALAAFAAVYVIAGRSDNEGGALSPPPASEQTVPASGSNKLSTGTMTTFVFKDPPAALPEFQFVNADGKPISLKDWRGKVVLLNLWATWCAPCRGEMPALDRLESELGSDKFEVVALAVDKSGLEGARKFLAETKAGKLKLYADPTARVGNELKVIGMPTTILVDAEGREIGRLIGPAEWDSADAKRLIQSFLK
jgi:thiol-disulfide isomerase/thioredoxin